MFGTDVGEEDDASINEPADVPDEAAKEEEVVEKPPATAADFYILPGNIN